MIYVVDAQLATVLAQVFPTLMIFLILERIKAPAHDEGPSGWWYFHGVRIVQAVGFFSAMLGLLACVTALQPGRAPNPVLDVFISVALWLLVVAVFALAVERYGSDARRRRR